MAAAVITQPIDHLTLILTIIVAGLLGGVINYYMVHTKEEEFSNEYIFSKSIFLGLGAAALVPLFLRLISSTLLEPVTDKYPIVNYFVIGGFCLAAAIYSKRFIEDVYGRITKAEEDAKAAKKTAEEAKKTSKEVEQSVTEPDDTQENLALEMATSDPNDAKALIRKQILEAIQGSRFVYRTPNGIAKEIGKDKKSVKEYLNELQESGLVSSKINKNGNLVYKVAT